MDHCKILILSTNRFSYDGISNVIANYYSRIRNSNLQLDIAICQSSNKDRLGVLSNIFRKVYLLPERQRKLPNYLLTLCKIIHENRYDTVHVHGNSGTMSIEMLVALLSGVKVRIAHSHNSSCNNHLLHKILKPLLNKLTTFNFACSKLAGDWLFNSYHVLNNGINTAIFSFSSSFRNKHRTALNLNNCIVIGHIGHFSYQKNHEFLIRVFKEIYDISPIYHLLLIGSGITLDNINSLIYEHNLQDAVTILEDRDDVNELLSAMDIFVLPSRFEGLPLSGIEAQASGLPCFVSDKISRELNLSNTVIYLPISETRPWVEQILSHKIGQRKQLSSKNISILKRNGYDIVLNAENLTKKYLTIGDINV